MTTIPLIYCAHHMFVDLPEGRWLVDTGLDFHSKRGYPINSGGVSQGGTFNSTVVMAGEWRRAIGDVVPSPGAVALIGLAGVVAGRRRRG